jgi:large exoprotein involved in heme utilization and adhesion
VLEASSQLGLPGQVQISAPRTDVISGLPALPAQFFDASGLLREACGGRAGASRLVGVGRGGVTTTLSDYAASRYFEGEGPATAANEGEAAARSTSVAPAQSVLLAGICASSG